MGHQLGQFGSERFLGQADGFIEPRLHALAFLPIQLGIELAQIVGWFHAGEIKIHGEHAHQGVRIIRRIE